MPAGVAERRWEEKMIEAFLLAFAFTCSSFNTVFPFLWLLTGLVGTARPHDHALDVQPTQRGAPALHVV